MKDQLEIVKVKVNGKIKIAIQPLEEQLSFDKVGSLPHRGRAFTNIQNIGDSTTHAACDIAGVFCLHSCRAEPHRSQPWRHCGMSSVPFDFSYTFCAMLNIMMLQGLAL